MLRYILYCRKKYDLTSNLKVFNSSRVKSCIWPNNYTNDDMKNGWNECRFQQKSIFHRENTCFSSLPPSGITLMTLTVTGGPLETFMYTIIIYTHTHTLLILLFSSGKDPV